jgi:hypothetical protein
MKRTIFLSALLTIILIAFSCCKKDKSDCLTCPPPPPDTTSHVIQWQLPDTLGAQGIIRDVWVFDRNNAWAVGEIYLNDSTGKPDMENMYNAAHWDGSKWEIKGIPFIGTCSAVHYPQLMAIWAFSSTSILVSNGGSIVSYDGLNAVMDCRMNSLLTGAITKIFATSNQNVYLVGRSGNIVHYNGNSWTKMTSNTTVDLQDIWGIDGSHIWATGSNTNDGHSVILSFDGTKWNIIYDSNNVPVQEWYNYNSVWTDDTNILYLSSGGLLRKLNLTTMTFATINTGQTYISFQVRGTKRNDIFVTGQNSEIAHFNGSTWKLYEEIQNQTVHNVWWYSIKVSKDFIVVGGTYYTGYNSAPIILRGYR